MSRKKKTCRFCTREAVSKSRFSFLVLRPIPKMQTEKNMTLLCETHRAMFRDIRDEYGHVTVKLMRQRVIDSPAPSPAETDRPAPSPPAEPSEIPSPVENETRHQGSGTLFEAKSDTVSDMKNKESKNSERNQVTMNTEKTNSETIKTQTKAGEYCGISRHVLAAIEKKHPEIEFKNPNTKEYDKGMLDAVLAERNPHYIKELQTECLILIGEIQDPVKLKMIINIIRELHKIKTLSQRLIEHGSTNQN